MSTPFARFQAACEALSDQREHRRWMQAALRRTRRTRADTEAEYADWQAARRLAAERKWQAIEGLDRHLEQLASGLEARGTHVFWADDGEAARGHVLGLLRRCGAKTVVKSKSMTTEEILLNELLETEGFEVVESDLGEFIVQLREEAPYHIVCPAMHLKRGEVGRLFRDRLGAEETTDPEELTMIARRVLRRKYVEADVGISGANFGIAETGMISITENEGNARLTTSLPRIHVAIMGIEKVLPRLEDLALLLPMLATSATGQALSCYNSLIGGPRQPGESDGPDELHVVLLDNGRSRLLADPVLRDALRCIRCGACLNVCPVFENLGGHGYGTTYQGPIGALITPHLRGLAEWSHLSSASSLCGACAETCPVDIDVHHHLLRNRRLAAEQGAGLAQGLAFKAYTAVMRRPALYRLAGRLLRPLWWLARPLRGTRLDPLGAWRRTRELPQPARRSFKDEWRARR